MIKTIIGIDGGATKTHGAMFDQTGNILKQHFSGFCNFGVDEDVSKKNIKEAIDALLKQAEGECLVERIIIGSAGYSKLKNKDEYIADLKKEYGIEVMLVTDAQLALASIRKNEYLPTILILGGTGSIVLATKANQLFRVGGSGHLLGDEGSAYHLAIKALKHVINEFESTKKLSEFSIKILQEINIENREDLIHFVYSKNKKEIADLSKVISALAISQNEEAITLLKEEGLELAEQAIKAYGQLASKEQVIIGLQGGFLLNAPHVRETLIERLNESNMLFKLCEDHPDPVVGAYYLGSQSLRER